MNQDRETATRGVDLEYDAAENRMEIVYNPGNTGGTRTRVEVQPWSGTYEFIVDESGAAGCNRWFIRVRVDWQADAALAGDRAPIQVQYTLDEFDCRNLAAGRGR